MQGGTPAYRAKIMTHVAAYDRPNVTSIADDIHIFHFEDGDEWRTAPIMFVNRNGHQFRVVKGDDGLYQFIKHWEGKPDFWHWETWATSSLRRTSAEDLIRLTGTGPQGKISAETLALLPKGLSGRRKAVWRDKILNVRWDIQNDAFAISTPAVMSPFFKGKMWASTEAADWCRTNLGGTLVSVASDPHVKAQDEEMMMELEGSDMWGMF